MQFLEKISFQINLKYKKIGYFSKIALHAIILQPIIKLRV